MEPGDLAVVGIGIHCAASVRNSAFRLSLPDKAGIAADDQLLPGAFPGSSSIPDAASMAGFRMVSGSVGIFRRGFRGSSGPYIQWKTLLVSRNAIRRDALRTVRKSQSLRGTDGAVDSYWVSNARSSGGSQAADAADGSACGATRRGSSAFRVARRDHRIRMRGNRADCFALDSPGREETFIYIPGGSDSRRWPGRVAWRWSGDSEIFHDSQSGSHRRTPAFDGEGRLPYFSRSS